MSVIVSERWNDSRIYFISVGLELHEHCKLLYCLTQVFNVNMCLRGQSVFLTSTLFQGVFSNCDQLNNLEWKPRNSRRQGACPNSHSPSTIGTNTEFAFFGSWLSFLLFMLYCLCVWACVCVFMHRCVCISV